jgi:hypothetical protein
MQIFFVKKFKSGSGSDQAQKSSGSDHVRIHNTGKMKGPL